MPANAPSISKSYGSVTTSGTRSISPGSTSNVKWVGWKTTPPTRPKLVPLENPEVVVEVKQLPSGSVALPGAPAIIISLEEWQRVSRQDGQQYFTADEWNQFVASYDPGNEQTNAERAGRNIAANDSAIIAWSVKAAGRAANAHVESLKRDGEPNRYSRMTVSR